MQAKWFWLGLMCLEISSLAQAAVELPKSTEHLLVEMVPMRDGVKLFTTIEVPQQGKKYPVLLLRNLYRRRTEQIAESQDIAGRNFIAIHQDVRGSGRSEGVWHAFLQERNDAKTVSNGSPNNHGATGGFSCTAPPIADPRSFWRPPAAIPH